MELITIQASAEEMTRDLHTSGQAIKRLRSELTNRLANVATGSPDNGRADELRQDIATHCRVLDESPEVISLLRCREAELQLEQKRDQRQEGLQENDRLFFEALELIVSAGSATPADLAELRRLAANSSNPGRKYDIDRLVDALEDHDRYVKSARQRHSEPPVFGFTLEEKQGGN